MMLVKTIKFILVLNFILCGCANSSKIEGMRKIKSQAEKGKKVIATRQTGYAYGSPPKTLNQDWISKIKNNPLLSDMSIPGTHDSCSRKVTSLAETQYWTLEEQLDAGIRYFDIRMRHYKNAFIMHHGSIYLHKNFDDVMLLFKHFLSIHPREFLIMRVKPEYKEESNTRSFSDTWDSYYDKWGSVMAFKGNLMFGIDEIRGKVLILNNFVYNNSGKGRIGNGGLNWTSPNVKIQDDYDVDASATDYLKKVGSIFGIKSNSMDAVKTKKAKIDAHFKASTTSNQNLLYINHCSAYADLITPATFARSLNAVALDYKGRLGIVVMDFPGEDVISHIINQNSVGPTPNLPKSGKTYLFYNAKNNGYINSKAPHLKSKEANDEANNKSILWVVETINENEYALYNYENKVYLSCNKTSPFAAFSEGINQTDESLRFQFTIVGDSITLFCHNGDGAFFFDATSNVIKSVADRDDRLNSNLKWVPIEKNN